MAGKMHREIQRVGMILNRSLVSDVVPATNIFHRRIQQKDTVSSERRPLGEISMLVSACRKIVSAATAVLCEFLFALRTYLCERTPPPLSFFLSFFLLRRRHHRHRSSSCSSSSSSSFLSSVPRGITARTRPSSRAARMICFVPARSCKHCFPSFAVRRSENRQPRFSVLGRL